MLADRTLRVGTRTSRLARWQTDAVVRLLRARWPQLRIEHVPISTIGDRVTDVPLPRIGDKGIFTRELEDGLRDSTIDFAVHSLKDLPTEQPDGLTLAAVLERDDPCDALVGACPMSVATLAAGARVGTSSLRRRAQLLALRPDLDVRDLRGNVPTRLDKVLGGELDAAVLALAGLTRLDMTAHVRQILPPQLMLPAPGQGAIAVQARADDGSLLAVLSALDHAPTRLMTSAERALLGQLEGGCQVPVGALAVVSLDGVTTIQAVVSSLDGRQAIRRSIDGRVATEAQAIALGRSLAGHLLSGGADAILRDVRRALPLPRGVA